MNKIYISGPISDLHENVYKARFKHASKILSLKGYKVISPIEINHSKHAGSWADYMMLDLKALIKCSSIYMLSGWELSRGAKIEHAFAVKMGMTILYQNQ